MYPHKFRLTWLSTLLVSTLLLSGCAPVGTQPPAAVTVPQPTAAPETITIVHWQHHHEARAAIVQELIADFQAANPNITIKFESIPYTAYWEKLAPSLEAGTGPDVFQLPGNIVLEFYRRGQLAPVPEAVMSAAEIEEAFVGWTIQLLNFDGTYYGLPTDVQTFLLFYNDDLFREAGLDPTKDLETWEDFREAAIQLTRFEGDTMVQAGVELTTSPYQWYWSMPQQVFDAGVVDPTTLQVTYDSPAGYDMWRFLTDLVVKDKVDSPEFLAEQGKFIVGKAAMNLHEYVFAGNLRIAAPDLNYSVHLPPRPEGRPLVVGGTHWAYVVSTQSKNPEAAWAWVKFLTSEEAQRKWVAGGGELPSRKGLLDDATLRADSNVAVGLDSMQYARPFNSFGWDDVWYIHQAVWDEVVLNGVDVRSAVDKAAQAEEKLYADKKLSP